MAYLKYILFSSFLVLSFLFITIVFSTPPALSKQIDVKTMSPIKLNTYVDNYTSDYGPSGSAWGAGSFSGK